MPWEQLINTSNSKHLTRCAVLSSASPTTNNRYASLWTFIQYGDDNVGLNVLRC